MTFDLLKCIQKLNFGLFIEFWRGKKLSFSLVKIEFSGEIPFSYCKIVGKIHSICEIYLCKYDPHGFKEEKNYPYDATFSKNGIFLPLV